MASKTTSLRDPEMGSTLSLYRSSGDLRKLHLLAAHSDGSLVHFDLSPSQVRKLRDALSEHLEA